jgi:hypothetical protein
MHAAHHLGREFVGCDIAYKSGIEERFGRAHDGSSEIRPLPHVLDAGPGPYAPR